MAVAELPRYIERRGAGLRAFDDPRIKVAARMLGFSFERLFVRLQKLWSWATTQETDSLHQLTIAELTAFALAEGVSPR